MSTFLVAGANGGLGHEIARRLLAPPSRRAKLHGFGSGRHGRADWTGAAAILAPTLTFDAVPTKENRA